MLKFNKSLIVLLVATIASASVSFSSSAYVTDEAIRYYRSLGYTSWAEIFAAGYNQDVENSINTRTDWPRETADTPVESVYNGIPENNIEGQFDMAGAIKAFEYAQLHRFPRGLYDPQPLKSYVWDDNLAGFAQKILLDGVKIGKLDRGWVYDSTGRFDQSRVYSYATYLVGTTGYPYDIYKSSAGRGKTVDEAIQSLAGVDGSRGPLAQREYPMRVGAAVLNHNGEKLLLFVMSEEGLSYTWKYFDDHGGVDYGINQCSMAINLVY